MRSARERLIRFYQHYNPDCLPSVDAILEIYSGREEEIFSVLEEKYGPEPDDSLPMRATQSAGDEKDEMIKRLSSALREKSRELARVVAERGGSSAPRTPVATGDVKRLATLLEQERAKSSQLEALLHEKERLLSSAQREVDQLKQRAAQDADTIDELRQTIEDFNENELVLLREVGMLKLRLGDSDNDPDDERRLAEWEQRVAANFKRRIAELEKEMKHLYETAQLEIDNRDARIRALTSANGR